MRELTREGWGRAGCVWMRALHLPNGARVHLYVEQAGSRFVWWSTLSRPDCGIGNFSTPDAAAQAAEEQTARDLAGLLEALRPPHQWRKRIIGRQACDVCTVCGIVRRADDGNKPCKGPTRMALRGGGA